MIISLVDKLISRVIDLINEKNKAKVVLHDRFVIDLVEILEEIHNNYIDTFVDYIEVIKSGSRVLTDRHPVFEKIEKDQQYSETSRIKLQAMWKALESKGINDNDLLGFLYSIDNYFFYSMNIRTKIRGLGVPNYSRIKLSLSIKGAKRKNAIYEIEQIIRITQQRFSEIYEHYQFLKMKLVR